MTPIKCVVLAAMAVTCGSVVSSLWADARPNPYSSIADRNPFGIKPPPPPPVVTPPEVVAPQAKVVLTGVTSMFGPPRALLEITESEPGKGPVVSKRILREGDRDGSIEVLAIDVGNTSVRIRNGTVETNIVFAEAKTGPTGPGTPGAFPTPPGTFVPPTPPNPLGALHQPGAPNPGANPYIISPGGNSAGRSGSGVTLTGAAIPGAPTTPAGTTPGAYPNPAPTPPVPSLSTFGAPATPNQPAYGGNAADKSLPLRTMRTDLIDAARARALNQPK